MAALCSSTAGCSNGTAARPGPSAACAAAASPEGEYALRLEKAAAGFTHPVDFQPFPGIPNRWLVAQQDGIVLVVDDGRTETVPFADLRSAVTADPNSGLLGLALHPRFPNDPRVFVRYSIDSPLQTVLDEFHALPGDPTRIDPSAGRRLLAIGRDTLGHDGGSVLFGPDGLLYVTVGDGGPLGDPRGKARDLGKLSGKILRLDVDNGDPYRIPDSNPYVGVTGARAEIWASGLRNPWRASFDDHNGDLWVADVGENDREEVDRIAGGSTGGEDFGWNRFEGTLCFDQAAGCDTKGLTPPALEYPHVEPGGAPPGGPCAVVGGAVYRGCTIPEARGAYFYGDFCAGFVRSFRYASGTITDEKDWTESFRASGLDSVSAFGTDARGELYVMDWVDGEVFRIVPSRP